MKLETHRLTLDQFEILNEATSKKIDRLRVPPMDDLDALIHKVAKALIRIWHRRNQEKNAALTHCVEVITT